jgi:hypothetical protein
MQCRELLRDVHACLQKQAPQSLHSTAPHSSRSTQSSTHNTSPPPAAAHRTVFELRPMAFAFQAE